MQNLVAVAGEANVHARSPASRTGNFGETGIMRMSSAIALFLGALWFGVAGCEAQAKTAFVLSGGASKGSFEVGVLKKLYEEGVEPDILIGTSVGAINAAKLAEGQQNSIQQLYDLWMSLGTWKDMYLTQPWFDDVQEKIRDLEYQGTPDDTFGDLFLATKLLEDLQHHLNTAHSIYNLNPIRDKLDYCLDPTTVTRSGKILRISSVSLRTGDLVFIDESGELQYHGKQYQVDLRKAVLASASVPVVFSSQSLISGYEGFDLMVDGGVREVAPLEMARELGADTIFVILTSSPYIGTNLSMKATAMDVAGRTIDILVNEVMRNDLTFGLGGDDWMEMPFRFSNGTTVIYPSVRVHDGMTVDPILIRINADYGWMVASDVLHGLSRERTAELLASAHAIARDFLTGAEDVEEIRRTKGDYVRGSGVYERALRLATERAKELLETAVRHRQEVGGEIPDRLRPLLQGVRLAPPVISGVSVPAVVGRMAYQVTDQLRDLGLEVERVPGSGGAREPGTVIAQEPGPGQRLSAGCKVILTVEPDRAPSRKPAPRPGPSTQIP